MNNIFLRKVVSICLASAMILSTLTVMAKSNLSEKTVEAAYGTPIIDGSIDDIWGTTNYTFIDRLTPGGESTYSGWMKLLWDKDKLYVLAKVHTYGLNADPSLSPWHHDCIEIFIDENCKRTTTLESDDYQLRTNFKAENSTKNYPVNDLITATETFNMGFVVEMAIPMKTIKLEKNMMIGLDAQIRKTSNFAHDGCRIGWNAIRSDISSDTSDWGTLVLKQQVDVKDAVIPEYKSPEYPGYMVSTIPYSEEIVFVDNVSTMFNYSSERVLSMLHVNEYPCMEINDMASVIGATVENGSIIVKDGMSLKYTPGNRLMQDNTGNIIMQVAPVEYNNKLYVPLSSLETTLSYDIRYNRFAKELDIVPFNEPKEAEFIAYAKDYGAVGDGIHDDRPALTKAVEDALKSGKPSRVELDAGKIYYLSETMDMAHMFLINGAKDFVFNGNGSTILIEPSQFGFVQLTKSERVRFENFNIEAKEPMIAQGWIRGIDASNDTVLLEFEEGYPVLVPESWTVAHGQERDFIMPVQRDTLHPKYISKDYAQMFGAEHIEERLYKARLDDQGKRMIPFLEEGDRFAANYGYNNYDLNEMTKLRLNDGMFSIATSGEIELRNINTTAGKEIGCAVMNAWGNLKFNNFSSHKDGQIWPNGRDFIHTSGVRGTIVFENSKVVGCGDDIINTKGVSSSISAALGNRRYKLKGGAQYLQGDEVLFVDINNSVVLGRAFLEDVKYVTSTLNSETAEITLDREIEGIDISKCVLLNITEGAGGTIVRNNHFENGRRWVWVNRSPNCVFENNTCININSSMVAARNEFFVSDLKCEGPYPSAFTIRNNIYYCDGNGNPSYDPIVIESDGASFGDTAAIDGLLLEGNQIETSRVGTIIKIADVNELYMINNTIINHGENTATEMPITVKNCIISVIDGLKVNYDHSTESNVLNIAGCIYSDSNIKNIEILNGNMMKEFKDWWK